MDFLNFTFKLLKHGTIFLLRVVGIVAPVVGSALINASGRMKHEQNTNEWHGIPNIDAIEHPMWEETYGPNHRPW